MAVARPPLQALQQDAAASSSTPRRPPAAPTTPGRKARRCPRRGRRTWPADVAPWVRFRRKAVERFVGHVDAQRLHRAAQRRRAHQPDAASAARDRATGAGSTSKQLREAIRRPRPTRPPRACSARPARWSSRRSPPTSCAGRYPTILTIDRGGFKLRLFKRLKLARPTRSRSAPPATTRPAGATRSRTRPSTRLDARPTGRGPGSTPGAPCPAARPTTRSRRAGSG